MGATLAGCVCLSADAVRQPTLLCSQERCRERPGISSSGTWRGSTSSSARVVLGCRIAGHARTIAPAQAASCGCSGLHSVLVSVELDLASGLGPVATEQRMQCADSLELTALPLYISCSEACCCFLGARTQQSCWLLSQA